jgi:TetR/AcrR family fatty acid metabolism transcriptional regulator
MRSRAEDHSDEMKSETVTSPAAPVGRWGEREKGILEVATLLYSRHGYDNVSMATVAEAAGLSEGTLYNYFRDKQDLVLRVSLAAFEDHVAEAERIAAEAKTLREGLEGLIALQLRILVGAREIYRLWQREVRGAVDYRQSPARDMLRRFSTPMIRLLERSGVSDAKLGLGVDHLRDMVFGGVEQIAWTAIVQRRSENIDIPALSRALTRAYLRAFERNRTKMPARRRVGD